MLDRIAGSLERYMDLLSTRQKLVASNIANADTPGYKTQDLDFHFQFMSLAKGHQPGIIEAQGLKTKTDGNNVSIDREARLLAENAIRFNTAASLMRTELQAIRSAIQEGRSS
ncbi:MAG: flagellar basal body protein [Acidobacteria bacterium]|nr:flagellar basal body protein [Acidobacteriota bacterium]